MAADASSFDDEMRHLEAEIKRLEAEYNMFFTGRLRRLPWDTRARIDALVKRLDRAPRRNTAERFRFQTVQSRYAAFCELWERQIKAKEEGRALPGGAGGGAMPAATTASVARTPDAPPPGGVLHVATIRNPVLEHERLHELYEQIAEARAAIGKQPLPFDHLAAVVKAQVAKHGGTQAGVDFKISVTNGDVTLIAEAAKE
jgi:hypothetical protein